MPNLSIFDPGEVTESYRYPDFVAAYRKGDTLPVIEHRGSVTEWQKHFTKEDVPWATTNHKGLNTIWKIVDKAILTEEHIHFRPLSQRISRKKLK